MRKFRFQSPEEKRIEELEAENTNLKIQQAQSSMEMFNALSAISTQTEVNQATMMMELLNMIATLQGGE